MRAVKTYWCCLLVFAARSAVLALISVCAIAHHSFAMFDMTQTITVSGEVAEFQWTNPHVFIELRVKGGGGKMEDWSIEGATPNMLYRAGWRRENFKPGDFVSIEINPLRDGRHGGAFVSATLEDGRTLTNKRVSEAK